MLELSIIDGKWIRLVSNDEEGKGAVSKADLTFPDGTQANLFDLVSVECTPLPTKGQSENYLYDRNYRWQKIRTVGWNEAFSICKLNSSSYIFSNNDRSLSEQQLTGESLTLAGVSNIVINVVNEYDKKKWKADFQYRGIQYKNISVGDICVRRVYSEYGAYPITGNHLAVFSLTGKYELTGKYYKMLAQLF